MSNDVEGTYTANVRVRALPRAVDQILGMLATERGMNKSDIVRAALTEFAERHIDEIKTPKRAEV